MGSEELLRIGRLEPLEIVLDDSSVSRYHAEIRHTDRLACADLGSTNGTRLNGVRLGQGQWPLRLRDLLQFGEVAFVVDALAEEDHEAEQGPPEMKVDAVAASASWDERIGNIAFDSKRCPRPGDQLMALLRASHHLVHIEKEEDLLNSILNDAVSVLDAQRGAIVLADGPDQKLKLKALVTGRSEPRALAPGRGEPGGRFQFSQSLANRCVEKGESILCHSVDEDPELAVAKSIAEGAMASVLCVLLRTPRKRLGVLHLDRSPWQKPFTKDDLHLADALAANVSAGIECAQLLRKQRDLFLNTITILAQAVELRDEYTGGHTLRVTTYSLLLAENLEHADEDLELIRIGTPLHDIGKIGIDDAILRKPDKLTAGRVRDHEDAHGQGGRDRRHGPRPAADHPHRALASRALGRHGYPDGLAGEDISHLARVVALADAFDAMTSDRPYRKGMPPAVPSARSRSRWASSSTRLRRRVPGDARNRPQGDERTSNRAFAFQTSARVLSMG